MKILSTSTKIFIKKPMTKDKLKIGFVIDDGLDRLDGVQKYTVTLGEYFRSLGHDVHYLCGQTTRTDLQNIHSLAKNVSVRSNGGNQLNIPLPTSRAKLKNMLAQENFDVLHIQTPYSPFFGGKLVSIASKTTPVVGTFHILPFGFWAKIGSYLLGKVQFFSIRRVSTFFSVSSPAKDFAKRYFGIKSKVLANPVVIADFAPKKPLPKETHTVYLTYVNRLVKRKGCMELLQALSYALKQNTLKHPVELNICSDGYDRPRLEKFVAENNMSDFVHFRGYVSDKEKAQYMNQADIAVFPSLGGESFGIVLIEAMASKAGVVIGGNNPGYKSVLENPEALFDPIDTAGFAKILADFINNGSKRKKLHELQQAMIGQYDISVVGQRLLTEYRRLQKRA